MGIYTRNDIFRMVEEEDVEFIRLQFSDILGNLKNVAITSSQLESILDNQCMFDGSAIDGFADIEESDMFLHPDLDTFAIFPWRPQQGKVARFICDVYRADGTPFEGDSRYMLRKAIEEAREMGYEFEVGPECEFFLFDMDDRGCATVHTSEKAGYFEMGPNDFGENARRDMVLTLEDMGFEVEASHHEAAPGQHEIDLKYEPALQAADDIMTCKLAIKTIAKRHGLHATFMPKPNADVAGSGMHINMSLTKDGKNIFSDPTDPNSMSKEAYYFIGGLLKHVHGMSAVTNPLVNSYKRLSSGFEAPEYIAWSVSNRSSLIRVPIPRYGRMRVELRSPDPSANPYLLLALCLRAGLDGIKNQIEPPKMEQKNIYKMTDAERKNAGIQKLPGTLGEAMSAMRGDTFVRDVLGDYIVDEFLNTKEKEWEQYLHSISQWEIQTYLGKY